MLSFENKGQSIFCSHELWILEYKFIGVEIKQPAPDILHREASNVQCDVKKIDKFNKKIRIINNDYNFLEYLNASSEESFFHFLILKTLTTVL